MTQVPSTLIAVPASELRVGQKIVLTEPDGVGRVTSAKTAGWIKTADGHCIDVRWEIIGGPNAGEQGYAIVGRKDQVEIVP